MKRRTFFKETVKVVSSYALMSSLINNQLIAKSVSPITDHWLKQLNDMSHDLKIGGITPKDWQTQIETLYSKVPLHEIIDLVDFEQMIKNFEYPEKGVNTKKISFPPLVELPKKLAFYSKLFGMKKGRAVIPHGHVNMASCHYVLNGEVSLKQYDKIEESESHMIIKKTVDEIGKKGSYSSISDDQNNVHWLKATTDFAHTFDVIVLDISGKPYEVNNIDPRSAVKETDGSIKARKISVEEGLEKYGFDSHH